MARRDRIRTDCLVRSIVQQEHFEYNGNITRRRQSKASYSQSPRTVLQTPRCWGALSENRCAITAGRQLRTGEGANMSGHRDGNKGRNSFEATGVVRGWRVLVFRHSDNRLPQSYQLTTGHRWSTCSLIVEDDNAEL